MSHANRGTKRRCPHCGAAFYDLERSPVVCPKCHTPYVETPRLPSRPSGRPRAAEPAPVVELGEDEPAAFDEDEVLDREEADQDALGDEETGEDEDRD